MANSNQIELVVTVEVDKANRSIKSVNANLSSIEAAAARSARGASQGIDGMTASMVKGATAGNLLAEGIRSILGWVKTLTIEVAKYAARTEVLATVSQQLAKVNGVSAASVDVLVDRLKALGITTQEAHGVIQRMIFAQLDLGKATQLANVARNAAVIAGVDTSEALDKIILGITTGQTRLLHNMGLQVSLLQVETQAAKELGHALTDEEKRAAMLNAVIKEGVKIDGAYEAAMEKVGKQMTSLTRYFNEAKNAVGEQFLPVMRKAVEGAKDLAFWIKDNAAVIADFAKGIAALVAAGALGMLVQKLWGLAGALQAVSAAAMANPIGLIAAGVVAGAAVIYAEWRKMGQAFRDMDEAYQKWITGQITGAKTGADLVTATDRVEKAFAAGAIDAKAYAQALDMVDDAKRRVFQWGDISDVTKGLGIKVLDPKAEAAAAAALAEEVRKAQLANEKAFRDRALEAGKGGLTGFAKDIADVNAEIGKRTVGVDEKGTSYHVALTKNAWASIIDEMQQKLRAFKDHFAKENRKALADYLKDEEEANRKLIEYDAARYQQRLQNNAEIATRNMDHLREVHAFEQDRAGIARDARLRQVEGADAQTIQQKVAVEQQKAAIEIDYLEKVHGIKQRLYDMDTSRMALEEELILRGLGYRADEIKARITELTEQREVIREGADEANDAAVQAARENAANRATQMVRDHNQQIFDSLKQEAGGVFDALLSKSQSVWSAIGNSLKTALLTAIKDVVTSRVAAMLMQMFTGTRVSFAGGSAGSGGSGGGMLGGLGGMLSIGAAPVFGGGGGGGGLFGGGRIPGMGPGGTPPFLPQGGGGPFPTGSGMASQAGAGMLTGPAGWAGMLGNLKHFLGFGGGVQYAPGMATTWQAATMGQKLSAIGKSNAALMGGAMLAMDGLRRGGWLGVGETTAGGALIGFKFGGPLGAAIGAAAGFAAGMVRLFIKGAQEKAREKIKALYGVDISDKNILKQIVDTAKQAYGGNLDMAIRSKPVQELIQLYAMSTGQNSPLQATPRPVNLVQQGGSIFQSGGSPVGYSSAFPAVGGVSLDRLAPTEYGSGNPVYVNISLDGQATTKVLQGEAVQAVQDNPRVVQRAASSAQRGSYGRREAAATLLQPGTVLA